MSLPKCFRLLDGETAKRRVAVETELEASLPPVAADRVQLQQLVLNLIINGLDAMDEVWTAPGSSASAPGSMARTPRWSRYGTGVSG